MTSSGSVKTLIKEERTSAYNDYTDSANSPLVKQAISVDLSDQPDTTTLSKKSLYYESTLL